MLKQCGPSWQAAHSKLWYNRPTEEALGLAPYLALVIIIGGICFVAWIVGGNALLGWATLIVLGLGLGLPVLRFIFRRGAPDNKFPWE